MSGRRWQGIIVEVYVASFTFNIDDFISSGPYGSRGKGKRRFAAQGSWRSSHTHGESEEVLWLQRPPDAPLPAVARDSFGPGPTGTVSKPSGRVNDEVHLTQLAKEFWGTTGQSSFQASVVDGVYSIIVKTRYVYDTLHSPLHEPVVHSGWS